MRKNNSTHDNNPYLSIVIAARNDTHGKNFIPRFSLALKTLYHQIQKYRLATEIIIVEWNPNPQQPLLHKVLPAPPQNPCIRVRYIIVPPEIHHTYAYAKKLPLFQMIAKNVGIRRAKGTFILCTNADIILADALVHTLAKKTLQNDAVYRCTRCEVPPWKKEYEKMCHEQLLKYLHKNVRQRLGKNRWLAYFPLSHPLFFQSIPMQIFSAAISQILRITLPKNTNRINSLDMWACGDFTLMHKKNWCEIQGYAELDAYSLHIDSLGLGMAVAKGIRQIILPQKQCIYHMTHHNGWEDTHVLKKLHTDLAAPRIDYNTLKTILYQMIVEKNTVSLNNNHWGWAKKTLQEIRLPTKKDPQKRINKPETKTAKSFFHM